MTHIEVVVKRQVMEVYRQLQKRRFDKMQQHFCDRTVQSWLVAYEQYREAENQWLSA